MTKGRGRTGHSSSSVLVTTSKAPVTTSDALVSTSFLLLLVFVFSRLHYSRLICLGIRV